MRGLKHLLPEKMRDSLNQNPGFQWFVTILLLVIGLLLVYKGVNGVIHKRITDKRGREYQGGLAQLLGVLYAVMGAFLAVMSVVVKFSG
jgi:hypothetical protein